MEEKEIELIDYLRAIWKWKYFITAGTLVATLTAVIVCFSLPKIYRSTVTFLVTTSPVINNQNPQEQSGSYYELQVETYKGIIKNVASLLAALEKFQLGKSPSNFSLEMLQNKISLKSIPNSKLIQLYVELQNPQMAADIANFLAENAVNLNTKLSKGDTIEAQRFFNEEVQKIYQELQGAEKEYLDFQQKNRMVDRRKRMDTLLAIKSSMSQELSKTEIDLKSEISKEKGLEVELSKRSPKIILNKSLLEDPAFQQILASITSTSQKELLQITMSSENINEAYGLMDQLLVSSRVEVDQLEARLNQLKSSLISIDQELKTIQITLAQQGMEETKLSNRYQLASSVYQDFRRKLEEANIAVYSKSQDLKILDPAIIPSHPVKPRKQVIVMVTFLTAGIGFFFLAFLMEYLNKIIKTNR